MANGDCLMALGFTAFQKLSESPCSIVLVIPTPNLAEESAIPESETTSSRLNHRQRAGWPRWTPSYTTCSDGTRSCGERDSSAAFGVGMTKLGVRRLGFGL